MASPLGHPLLQVALAQAETARYLTSPNPSVGCVLSGPDGQVLGLGHTQRVGGPHAEVMALRDAQARGRATSGATAHVTLEPCAHQGRTPPCCNALIEAGVARVIVALIDPNPKVAGQGVARLRAAGVQVEVLPPDHPIARQARELNIGFFSRMIRGRPWVRLKVAASLDGRTALDHGHSQWITSAPARADGHAWRARACAVLTGLGTVLDDDPQLDVRHVDTPRQPALVVADSRLRLPVSARLFDRADRRVWVAHAARHAAAEAALAERGAELLHLPGPDGRIDLPALMHELARRDINELHVEAGHRLNGALLQAGCVDELLVYLAPTLLGPGREMARLPPLAALDQATRWQFRQIDALGADVRLLARLHDGDRF